MKKQIFTSGVTGIWILLALFHLFLFYSCNGFAAENKDVQQDVESKQEIPSLVPELAEIVPLENKLVSSLKGLEKQLQVGIDSEYLERGYTGLEAEITDLSRKVSDLKASQEYKYNKLIDLQERVTQKRDDFEILNRPVADSVRQLGILKKKWQAEQVRWIEWQTSLLSDGELERLKSTFNSAQEAIETAIDLILAQLDGVLTVQERAGRIETQLDTLSAEIDDQIAEERRNALFNDTPPMFSIKYLQQLKAVSLWNEVYGALQEISLPDRDALSRNGWILCLQAVIAVIITLFIIKRKNIFQEVEQWRSLALYPVASGLFLSYIACVLIYEYEGVPNSWKLATAIVGGVSFARLMRGVIEEILVTRFIQGLIAAVIITRAFDVLGLPIPVFRLYTFAAGLAGFFFCRYLANELPNVQKTGLPVWLLRAGQVFFAAVVFIEIWGKKVLASYLFVAFIRSIGTVLVFVFFMYIIRGGVEWLFQTPLLRRSTALTGSVTRTISSRLNRYLDVLIIVLIIIPAILMFYGVFTNLGEATRGVLRYGFTVGDSRITIGLILVAASILYASFLLSWVIQKLLIDELLFKQHIEKAARISIAKLVHYGIVVVAFLLAVSALGVEITKLTIMVSALGVGIGFGLKDIVNNFVSGLILLFEQPIRIGDLIELDGMWAEIKQIGIRSTIVRNFDHADMIIPNADLVANRVTNWTLGDRQSRMIILVGVAYGSDVELVTETLLACAEDNKNVADTPKPQALFLNFGDSTLDFELRVFVPASQRIPIRSELHHEIDKRFREKDITIAFPQREVHLPGIEMNTPQKSNTAEGIEPI